MGDRRVKDDREGQVCSTERDLDVLLLLGEGLEDVALDFAEGEELVGIDVLGASRLVDTPESPAVELQDLIARSAAA